jgi:hypothetical protein
VMNCLGQTGGLTGLIRLDAFSVYLRAAGAVPMESNSIAA